MLRTFEKLTGVIIVGSLWGAAGVSLFSLTGQGIHLPVWVYDIIDILAVLLSARFMVLAYRLRNGFFTIFFLLFTLAFILLGLTTLLPDLAFRIKLLIMIDFIGANLFSTFLVKYWKYQKGLQFPRR